MINPYTPSAGHVPPFLAGRRAELDEFKKLLKQKVVQKNLVLTGLRGVGKTVLLEELRPLAREAGWLWVATDLSESASLSEERVATRLLTDLALVTSALTTGREIQTQIGFGVQPVTTDRKLNYEALKRLYEETPGLVADKLKEVLQVVWKFLGARGSRGIVFAYDEAQNLTDHKSKNEFPLSLLLDVFQSIQRKSIPFMLVLVGLPTLFPKLVEARTYTERMFHILFLTKLSPPESREAVVVPLKDCELRLSEESIEIIVQVSGGYPYFIQFICKEVFDLFIDGLDKGRFTVPVQEIVGKLDVDFFSGRWSRATDRQRDLLWVAAHIDGASEEFTVKQLVEACRTRLTKAMTSSHIGQMLNALADAGLVYRDRHGKYSFAVPLMDQFLRRQDPPEGAKR